MTSAVQFLDACCRRSFFNALVGITYEKRSLKALDTLCMLDRMIFLVAVFMHFSILQIHTEECGMFMSHGTVDTRICKFWPYRVCPGAQRRLFMSSR